MADRIAQAVFGLLFEASELAALIVDRTSGRIVSANVRAADLLSRTTEALLGARFEDLVDDDRDVTLPGRYEDVVLRRAEGDRVHVIVNVAHIETVEHGALAAYLMRDTTERHLLELELIAKHGALYIAHAELERAHVQLTATKGELERRNQDIAMLAWRTAMGQLVAGIAHHLNNPVGALASTVRPMNQLIAKLPIETRSELQRLFGRVDQIARRIESNVAAIVSASRGNKREPRERDAPPELELALAKFAERLDHILTRESL